MLEYLASVLREKNGYQILKSLKRDSLKLTYLDLLKFY